MKATALALAIAGLLPALANAAEPKVAKALAAIEGDARVSALIVLRASDSRAPLVTLDRVKRIDDAYLQARRRAKTAQAGVAAALSRRGVAYRAFDNVPVIAAKLTKADIAALASREDVASITTDPIVRLPKPQRELGPVTQPKVAATGIEAIGAPVLWAQGHDGSGIVVGGADTGYLVTHPALRTAYRGFNATYESYDHEYNWRDGVREPIAAENFRCAPASSGPCDDDGHGTHTMGTMVGRDGVREIGVAPGAKWIGCRNMDRGQGRPSTYLDCFEWFLAPTDSAGLNPRPDLAPHVINNSWVCPPSEGCDAVHTALLREATNLLESAGILVVAAAGNAGPDCGSIAAPPATFAAAFTVAAAGTNGTIAGFSGRGPAWDQGTYILKPDIAAPGINIQSSTLGNDYTGMSGTSMASPHVAGAAALLMSAVPELIGDPALIRQAMRVTASPRTDSVTCGGYPSNVVPNPVYGSGFLDVPAAFAMASAEFLLRDGFE